MKNEKIALLWYLFWVSLIIKIFFSFMIKAPTIMGDEAFYFNYAREIYQLNFFPSNVNWYGFLYPLVISPAFIFKNVEVTYTVTKIINCFLSSMIVFPAYFLAREIVDHKKAVVIAGLSLCIPYFVISSFYVMSENLYYLLFLTSVFLIIKTYNEPSKKYEVLCGLVIACTVLTKSLGLILLLGYLLINAKELKKRSVVLISVASVILPYYLARGFFWGWNENGILGITPASAFHGIQTGNTLAINVILMIFSHIGYIIISTGIIFFVLSLAMLFSTYRRHEGIKLSYLCKFTWLLWILLILTIALFMHGEQRIVGRYIDCMIPFFLLLGSTYAFKYPITERNRTFYGFFLWIVSIIFYIIVTTIYYVGGEISGIRGYNIITLCLVLLGYHFFIGHYTPKTTITIHKCVVIWTVIFFILSCSYSFSFLKEGSIKSYEESVLVKQKENIFSDPATSQWDILSAYFWTGKLYDEKT